MTGLLALALAGCGYQLKGQFSPPDGLSPLVWQSDAETDTEDLFLAMRETFALYGLVLRRDPADVLLRVHRQQSSEIAFSDADILALEVEWSLVNAYGVPLIDHETTRVESRLELSPELDADEARIERRNFLRNRIALRVLDRMESITAQELNRRPPEEP